MIPTTIDVSGLEDNADWGSLFTYPPVLSVRGNNPVEIEVGAGRTVPI